MSAALFATACPSDDGSAEGDADATTAVDSSSTTTVAETTGTPIVCEPGDLRCSADLAGTERCAPTGKAWIVEPCGEHTTCVPCDGEDCTEDRCLGPCESDEELPSSAGCSFIANRQLHEFQDIADGLVVANPNGELVANVRHYLTAEGTNQEELIDEVLLNPLEAHVFELNTTFVQGLASMYRTGGTHRVESDVPVIAYHHAPLQLARGNDSSMLLPESALRGEYVVPSYAPMEFYPQGGGEPSYFEVVALENFTTLEWFPKANTNGDGLPIPAVLAGESGMLKMNRFDTVRIAASATDMPDGNLRDVSGTVISADKKIWVTSGVRCSRVPFRDPAAFPGGHCDPLQELVIPLEYWGTTYVGAASPPRDDERNHWRVYAGKPGVTITTAPPQPGTPFTLDERGDYFEFSVASGEHIVFDGDGAFMPVQYLQSDRQVADLDNEGPGEAEPLEESTEKGAPSMYQFVPVEQFLTRYVFATALNFPTNYVQVIRPIGGAEVVLDDTMPVSGFVPVGEYEVADVLLPEANDPTEGTHKIESDEPFGIIQIGYSLDEIDDDCYLEPQYEGLRCHSSYAYPGGMKSEITYIP